MLALGKHGLLILACTSFFVRGVFYCVQQPIWEGFDEWAHFAYIQHMAEHGELPHAGQPVSEEVRRSLLLVPLAPSAAEAVPGSHTHDSYWRLPFPERTRREVEFRGLDPHLGHHIAANGPAQYEAQQPPLYYVLMAPLYLGMRGLSLPARVLVLRVINLLIAAAAILLGYLVAREVRWIRPLAAGVAVLVASLAGLLLDACRVGNSGLSVVLIAAVLLSSIRLLRNKGRTREWVILGSLTGAALLTKAYALALVPLLPLVVAVRVWRDRPGAAMTVARGAVAAASIVVTAGVWYAITWAATGTAAGEQLHAAAAGAGFSERLAAALSMNWAAVLDSAAFTHVWIGGWSFLVVRAWMYRVFEVIGVVGLVGILGLAFRLVRRWRPSRIAEQMTLVAAACTLMWAALAYHSIVIFVVKGLSTGIGWYLNAVLVAEVVLLACGFRALFGVSGARCMLFGTAVLSLAFEVYTTNFILAPYYAGLIRHRSSGSLEAFHLRDLSVIGEIAQRLSLNEPAGIGPGLIVALWIAATCAAVALVAACVWYTVRLWRTPALP